MQDENLKRQEESVQKQEAMRRCEYKYNIHCLCYTLSIAFIFIDIVIFVNDAKALDKKCL